MWKTNRKTGRKYWDDNNERISKKEIENMIKVNQKINSESKEIHGHRRFVLNRMLADMARHNEEDKRERIVNKAMELVAGFHYEQPFHNSNKRTGLVTLVDFLDKNGYRIKQSGFDEYIELGKKWNTSYEDDRPKLYADFRDFLDRNIEPKV